MNRIYIIGNGFDLSHGLPTGYNDFVKYLIKKEVFNFIDGFPKNFTHKDLYHKYFGDLIIKDPEMKNYFRNNTYYTKGDYELKYFEKLKSEINADPINNLFLHFNKHPENEFIIKVLDSKHHLWGKIEILYFDLLKKYYKKINPEKTNIEEIKNKVKILNNNLEYIKNELVSYLTHVQQTNKNDYSESGLYSILDKYINTKTDDVIKKWDNINLDSKINIQMNEYLFLNFNYTDTISYLVQKSDIYSISMSIHGNIKKPNDIIFGFGDENTNEYREIENSEDVFLENIKSFKYLKNNNYDKLMGFIDSDHYEVYLLGHSCSVTDRVLLKKIFESPNCITIKIIPKHGNYDERLENYNQILYNIARIFEDNGMMREKVIPFQYCDVHLPNIKKFEITI